jgi:hypothetical protein
MPITRLWRNAFQSVAVTFCLIFALPAQSGSPPPPCPGAICDNTDIGFEALGEWKPSTTIPGFFASNYLHDLNTGKGTKTASWTFEIAENGDHEIAAQWSSLSNRAVNVQYLYSVDGFTPQTCGPPVDQRINGGQFNVLCTVPGLVGMSTLTVILNNAGTEGYLIADAVRVMPPADVPGPTGTIIIEAESTLGSGITEAIAECPEGFLITGCSGRCETTGQGLTLTDATPEKGPDRCIAQCAGGVGLSQTTAFAICAGVVEDMVE